MDKTLFLEKHVPRATFQALRAAQGFTSREINA